MCLSTFPTTWRQCKHLDYCIAFFSKSIQALSILVNLERATQTINNASRTHVDTSFACGCATVWLVEGHSHNLRALLSLLGVTKNQHYIFEESGQHYGRTTHSINSKVCIYDQIDQFYNQQDQAVPILTDCWAIGKFMPFLTNLITLWKVISQKASKTACPYLVGLLIKVSKTEWYTSVWIWRPFGHFH